MIALARSIVTGSWGTVMAPFAAQARTTSRELATTGDVDWIGSSKLLVHVAPQDPANPCHLVKNGDQCEYRLRDLPLQTLIYSLFAIQDCPSNRLYYEQ